MSVIMARNALAIVQKGTSYRMNDNKNEQYFEHGTSPKYEVQLEAMNYVGPLCYIMAIECMLEKPTTA